MFTTTTPCSWHSSITSRGTPSPATNTEAPPRITSSTWVTMSAGIAVSRSTPKGLSVASRTAAISWRISSRRIAEAPRQPNPPASDTAATRRWYDTPPMPASITGRSICRVSVRRVRSMGPRLTRT
jgi:hypothetical protein